MKCGNCPNEAVEGLHRCQRCRDRKNAWEHIRYERLKKAGICTACRKVKAIRGLTRCINCNKKWKLKASNYMNHKRNLPPEEFRMWCKARKAKASQFIKRMRAEGKCIKCCKVMDREGWRCIKCNKWMTDYTYRRRAKFTRRQGERTAHTKSRIVETLKTQLGSEWSQVKDWVESNWELYKDNSDQALFNSREIFVNEDFTNESLGG